MNREKLKGLYEKYELEKDDVFKHQHYIIITRSGIEKIQAKAEIEVNYEVIKCERDFCVVKAYNDKLSTYGSALKGSSMKDGNCNTWYVMEMAEKRALSRLVLKQTGFYQLGVFGQDESEEFKKPKN